MAEDAILEDVIKRDAMQEGGDDLASYIGQIYYLVKDDLVLKMLMEDEDLKPLIFVLSHLVRTTRMDKQEIKKAKLRWKIACRLQTLCQKKPDMVSLATFNALMVYGNAALEDTRGGWRGLLVTERVKTYKVGVEQQRRTGFLGLLGVR